MLTGFKKRILNLLGIYILPLVLDLYLSTVRIKINRKINSNKKAVYIFWHGKMLMGWRLFKGLSPSAIVSESKDGEILTKILNNWGYKVFRGSSSRGGKTALDEMTKFFQEQNIGVITPDGPRGPANEIKNGALMISFNCKIPIVPVKIKYGKHFILNSWDKFEIPLPFTTCQLEVGEPVFYEEFLFDEKLMEFKEKLSSRM